MDLKGSLVDTTLRIYPADNLIQFLETISLEDDTPRNILKLIGKECDLEHDEQNMNKEVIQLTDDDYKTLNKIIKVIKDEKNDKIDDKSDKVYDDKKYSKSNNPTLNDTKEGDADNYVKEEEIKENKSGDSFKKEGPYLTTSDIDWLYLYLQRKRSEGVKDVPFLHTLLKEAHIEPPENRIIKRNPVLEARCVKLRAQQEAREYRKMTKTVDNVRIRFPEDSISYQLKQINRQLIAIGQFIISIFAGFLFGFRGVEWMVGNLDFGFRLLLGVMCALVIALAEIYFLAKKLNEELNVPETVQLGGPPKFANENAQVHKMHKPINKDHQD